MEKLMFLNAQEIILTGDNRCNKQLVSAVTMLINGYNFHPRIGEFADDGCLVLHAHENETSKNKAQKYIIDEIRSKDADFIVKLIDLYLSTSQYEDALCKKPRMDDVYDGHCYAGWKLILDASETANKIIIEPWWAFYPLH
jgi:hypothetical protein